MLLLHIELTRFVLYFVVSLLILIILSGVLFISLKGGSLIVFINYPLDIDACLVSR